MGGQVLGQIRDALGAQGPEANAEQSSQEAQDDGFDQELGKDVPPFGADGLANANLPGAFR